MVELIAREREKRLREEDQNVLPLENLKAYAEEINDSGNTPAQTGSTPATSTPGGGTGSLFGGLGSSTTTTQPQQGNSFAGLGASTSASQRPTLGLTTTPSSQPGGSLFGGGLSTGTNSQQPQSQAPSGGGSLFGGQSNATNPQQQQQSSGLFGGLGGTQQKASGGGSLFGQSATTPQPQTNTPFGGLGQAGGSKPAAGGLFGATSTQPQNQQQQQQQQQSQGPTLSLFANQNAASQQQKASGSTVVQGVKIDVSNLLPTTKFENCNDELKREIESADTFILNQIRMSNEVSDLLPTISTQGAFVPNDVEFVQGKLDALQKALEDDANSIEQSRNLVKQDAAHAKLAFRTIDTLLLPSQYQPAHGERWFSASQHPQSISKHSLRSTFGARRATLALPDDTEADSSASQGGPANLVEYFSQRADEMDDVLGEYRKNLKEIEDHLHGVELSVHRQIHDLASSRGRDGTPQNAVSQANQLVATLKDVEAAILGVAGRLGGTKEEVQEMMLGPLSLPGARTSNGW